MSDNATIPSGAPQSGLINRLLGGRYEVLESVGEGPLLSAFRARDRQMNRIVAVKALRSVFRDHAEITEKLRTGLGQILALNHPNIARAFDVGVDDETGTLYIAEEFARGIDLKERIRRVAPFSLNAATEVAIALVEALEYAHARGLAHGDVRPQNILVGPEGQVKVTGFGVAQAQSLALGADATLLRRVVAYNAPDIAGTGVPTPSSDLYSVGVILFEMLTGDLPYTGDGAIQIALKHAQEPIPSPKTLNQGVPRALEGIVKKSLGKRPTDRYASAGELLKDLRTVHDALRYGKSLAWSPLDAPPAPLSPIPVPPTPVIQPVAQPVEPGEDGTAVMPGRRQSRPTPPPPPLETPPVRTPAKTAMPVEEELPPVRIATGSRVLAALNWVLAIAFVGICGYVVWFTFQAIKPPQDVIVPNLNTKTLTMAEALGAERNFKVEVVDEQFSDKVANGVIYQQRPEPGRSILEGRKVSVWVSKGPKMVEIPDVRDVSFDKARQDLEKRGLRIGARTGEYDPIVVRGNVLRQSPEALENRPRGTKVDLVLSKGEEPLPDEVTPAATPEPTETPIPNPEDGRARSLEVRYEVPNDAASHRIRIDVVDKDGIRTVFDETRDAGEKLEQNVEGTGKRITIKIYDNDVLVGEQTK